MKTAGAFFNFFFLFFPFFFKTHTECNARWVHVDAQAEPGWCICATEDYTYTSAALTFEIELTSVLHCGAEKVALIRALARARDSRYSFNLNYNAIRTPAAPDTTTWNAFWCAARAWSLPPLTDHYAFFYLLIFLIESNFESLELKK